jgi:regulator of protease activity HflC (stomatin/prohibitin superfamily)
LESTGPSPSVANQKLQQLAVSIIRDRVANMTIDDILKKRAKLRDAVKSEM